MPTLSLRSVGMSYVIDGIVPSGLDPERFRDVLAGRYGPAMAVLSTPRSAQGSAPGSEAPIDAVILDRKASTRDELMAWLLDYVRESGHSYASWSGGVDEGSPATLHFHH